MIAIRDNIGVSETLTLSQSDYDNVNELMRGKYLNPKWNGNS